MSVELRIRTLRVEDLRFADRVREQAGWNQTLADWQRFIALEPEGCFLAELDGQPAGTATTTVYGGTELAWIGMVLVDESARRQGIGTALLEHAIAYLRDQRQVRCIKLDATPAGQPLYEKLGFAAEWRLRRWVFSPGGNPVEDSSPCAPPAGLEFPLDPEILDFDRRVFGADRSRLLDALAGGALAVRCDGLAYGMIRSGARANYIGPAVAPIWSDVEKILRDLVHYDRSKSSYWDIPDHCPDAIALAQRSGYRAQRELVRMVLGGARLAEMPECVFGIAEPGLG